MVGSRLIPHIRFYISDYGYGHASRCIALIRELHSTIDCKISVRTNTASDFIQDSCPYVFVSKKQNDIGAVMYPNTSKVDVKATKISLCNWLKSWDIWISDETKYCSEENVNLIISDITPQAFIVSKSLGIPGIGISNFTWELIFGELFGHSSEVQQIQEAYNCADLGIILPLNESMSCFTKRAAVPLVSRAVTISRWEMRKSLGISEFDKIVYIGSGLSFNAVPDCIPKLLKIGVYVVVSGVFEQSDPHLIMIPSSESETQNYIGMCDLIITKPGYSTVSESIRAKVPLIIFERDGFAEDKYIIQPLEQNSIGKSLTWEMIESGQWIDELDSYISMKNNYQTCSDIFIKDGVQACIEQIRLYL